MIRILIRTSRWAIWSRRLGSVAVPLLILPVLMHRAHGIGSDTFIIVLAFALLVAALALVSGLVAFVRLWSTGDRGWGRAVTGVLLGLICLTPAIYGTVQYMRTPPVSDVTTDWEDPPRFIQAGVAAPDVTMRAEIEAAFPNAVNRNYQLAPETVFTLIEELVAMEDWDVRLRRAPARFESPGQIIATVVTLLGFRDEISIVAGASDLGTRVAVRSRSPYSSFDLGGNGRRIESLLLALDARVSEWRRDNPQASS